MRETTEFRIPESLAERYLPADVGVNLGVARKVEVRPGEPLFNEIGRIDRDLRAQQGRAFFTAWIPHRRYTAVELKNADLLTVAPLRVFEPAGEECGTIYDDSRACPACGSGAPQMTPLKLDGRRIPTGVDFAQTISGENLVSNRVVDLVEQADLNGARFGPVLLTNDNERPSSEWRQLDVVSRPVDVDGSTRVGGHPFDDATPPEGACPQGHVLGLAVLSEVRIVQATHDGSDFVATSQFVGVRRGLLRPRPALLVSTEAWAAFSAQGLKGCRVEAARFERQ